MITNLWNELKNQALKFKNRDFLDASLAGAALVTMADGVISSKEKQKMVKFMDGYEELSVFTMDEVIEIFQGFVDQIELDKDVGEAAAYVTLSKIKDDEELSKLLLRMVIALGFADGNFDTQERLMAIKIAKALELNPSEFDLIELI
jgi:tellurite resistance protein TerB